MEPWILPLIVALAFFVVGPLLGTIAFFRVRSLNREIRDLKDSLAGAQRAQTALSDRAEKPESKRRPTVPQQPSLNEKTVKREDVEQPKDKPAEDETPQPASAKPSGYGEAGSSSQAAFAGSDAAKLEETVGAKWAVWVGGLALAFGAVFLVRYSIEQRLVGPGTRIILGLVFAAGLSSAGEWTRRRGAAFTFGGFENANVPSILTAAGTLGAFATIYAAYQLYGFLSPATAFFVLGIVAVATMCAALLHGPLLAALGIVGSYAVPFLISSQEPNSTALAIYAFAVSVAAFGVGRLKLWRWLAVIAACGLVFFCMVLFLVASQGDRLVIGLYIMASWCAVFYVFIASLYERDASVLIDHDRAATALLSLVILLGLVFVLPQTDFGTVAGLLLLIGLPFFSAYFYAAARYIVPVAAVAVLIGFSGWELGAASWEPIAAGDVPAEGFDPRVLPGYQQEALSIFGAMAVGLAALAGILGLYGAMRSAARVPLAFGGAFVPLTIIAIAYMRTDFLDVSVRYGALALILSVLFYVIAVFADRRLSQATPGRDGVTATYLIAALSGLALSLCLVLEGGTLTVALALIAPAAAYIYSQRPFKALRPLVIIPALLWVARIAWNPAIVEATLGTTPVFNGLLYGYGIPAAGFVLAAWLLSKHGQDRWLALMEAVAVASVTAAVAIIGLHAIAPDQIFTPIDTLSEAAWLVLVGGGVALGLLRLRRTSESATLNAAANVLGIAGMAGAVVTLLGLFNPLLTGEPVGTGLIFNTLLFAYFLTGLLYTSLGYFGQGLSLMYERAAFGVGGLMFFAWVSLTIRHWFHPGSLATGPTGDAELYTYSLAWLVIGIALLALGMFTGVRGLRLISGAVIVLVVAKVFLVDMANLEGILRALSFIGLGVVLVGVGLFYQRLLRPQV